MRFGSHLPIGAGFAKTVADALAAHCQCIQIFAGNPRAWRIAAFDASAWDSFRSARRRHGIAPTVIHTSYLVNLASANADLRRKSAALVAHDLSVAATAGIEYVNTHLGSYASSDCLAGLERVTRTVAALVRGAPRGPMLLLENSAGAGALCGAAIEELAVILDRVNTKRVGVCLDTAHLWAAGYDISDARGVASLLRLVERHIGLNRVMAWHLNDTQVELGSRRDLHWHIGRGRIGEAGFRALVRNPLSPMHAAYAKRRNRPSPASATSGKYAGSPGTARPPGASSGTLAAKRGMHTGHEMHPMIKAALITLSAALIAAFPLAALARAGGGQHFGGGGGGFGGGGGGLFSLWPLLFLGHGSGFSGLVVLLVILYFYQKMQSRGGQAWTPAPAQQFYGGGPQTLPADIGSSPIDPQAIAAGLSALKARDPNFDEREFLDRAQTVFFKVQQAWTARNQDIARDAMSQSLYERHKLQTDALVAAHRIDVLQDIVIGHARIADVRPGQPYDSIEVYFTASMTDYTIDEQSRQIVEGDRYPQTFTERWGFIRRSDAKSVAVATTLSSTCPACGAPLKLSDGKCDYCGAFVKTSSADWVVDTIEQIA